MFESNLEQTKPTSTLSIQWFFKTVNISREFLVLCLVKLVFEVLFRDSLGKNLLSEVFCLFFVLFLQKSWSIMPEQCHQSIFSFRLILFHWIVSHHTMDKKQHILKKKLSFSL